MVSCWGSRWNGLWSFRGPRWSKTSIDGREHSDSHDESTRSSRASNKIPSRCLYNRCCSWNRGAVFLPSIDTFKCVRPAEMAFASHHSLLVCSRDTASAFRAMRWPWLGACKEMVASGFVEMERSNRKLPPTQTDKRSPARKAMPTSQHT